MSCRIQCNSTHRPVFFVFSCLGPSHYVSFHCLKSLKTFFVVK